MSNSLYWQKCPPNPDDEWVGRYVKNAFNVDEIVKLMVRDWKHFDWLADQGVDMEKWTKDADTDRHRPEYRIDLGGEIQASLRLDERRRFLAGQPSPLFISPEGYDGPVEPEEIPERLKTDNDWFEREIEVSNGKKYQISMQGKYWRYFDWLLEKDGNLDGTIISAAEQTATTEMSIGEGLMKGLRRHERDHYLDGNRIWEYKVPLFISPNGYLDINLPKERNSGIAREFIDAKGDVVSIRLPKSYWQYFDWLAKQVDDMDQWVKEACVSRHKSKNRVLSLDSEIKILLREDEKRRFKSDEPSPLFINPDGYDL